MEKHRTEIVYDELMAPLVTQLIEIAKEHKVPLFVTAGMVLLDGKPGVCTTLVAKDVEASDPRLGGLVNRLRICAGVMQGGPSFDTAERLAVTGHRPLPKTQGDA